VDAGGRVGGKVRKVEAGGEGGREGEEGGGREGGWEWRKVDARGI